jgi:hypothetical protein
MRKSKALASGVAAAVFIAGIGRRSSSTEPRPPLPPPDELPPPRADEDGGLESDSDGDGPEAASRRHRCEWGPGTSSTGTSSTGTSTTGTSSTGTSPATQISSTEPPPQALTVSQAVSGALTLGEPASLTVTVTNPNDQAVDLTSVTATVTSVDSSAGDGPPAAPRCSPCPLRQRSSASARAGSTTASLAIRLVENGQNQDRCKNATYRFSYSATANQA